MVDTPLAVCRRRCRWSRSQLKLEHGDSPQGGLSDHMVDWGKEDEMFFIWAIPLALLILLVIWMLFGRLRHRVHGGERQEGRVLKQ